MGKYKQQIIIIEREKWEEGISSSGRIVGCGLS